MTSQLFVHLNAYRASLKGDLVEKPRCIDDIRNLRHVLEKSCAFGDQKI